MTITDFKALLAAHPDKTMRFVLPNRKSIPPSYHITEVGRVQKEAPIISQFSVGSSEIETESIVFHLENKHTDCLAKESCGLEASWCFSSEETSCCA